ncbi:hypothetical protein RQP46_005697 [Phenoliferia psychrophenolica]
MLLSTLLLATSPFLSLTNAWTLSKTHAGSDFFNEADWTFITGTDASTGGYVEYISQASAKADNLAYVDTDGRAIIAIDDTTRTKLGGLRNSVRIEGTATYGVGTLVIADFTHGK